MSVLHDLVNDIKECWTHFRNGRLTQAFKTTPFIIFTLLAVILVIYGAIRLFSPYWSEPPSVFKIAVVGPTSGSEKLTWDYIQQGIKAAQKNEHVGNLEGASLQIEYFDDEGNPATTQNIANKVCADSSFVLVMGFVESNVAKQALPIYGKSDCGLPVILIATTSTTLTEPNQKQWTVPILRLPPSNYQQAVQVIAALGDTFGTNPCRLVAFIDKDNAVYSDNLLDEFKNVLAGDKRTGCTIQSQDVEIYKAGTLEQTLSQKLSARPSADVLLFFGMTDKSAQLLQALAKVRHTSHLPQTKPIVIVSDGSTTINLIDLAKEDARCVWGSFPFGEPRDFVGNMPNTLSNIPSYYAYGHDALLIAMNTISDVGKKVTRENVKKEFEKLAKEKEFLRGMNGIYEFASDGGLRFFLDVKDPNHVLGQYHLWQVRHQGGKLIWDHRRWRDSLEIGCGN